MLRIGDDVRKAAGTYAEDTGGLVVRIAVGVQAGPSLGAEDEVARNELLFALHRPEHGTAAEHEEHLLAAVVHVHPHARGARTQVPERGAHPCVVRAPEHAVHEPGLGTAFVRVPGGVGEKVLTVHVRTSVALAVVAGNPPPSRRDASPEIRTR